MSVLSGLSKAAGLALALCCVGTLGATADPAGTATSVAPLSEVTGGTQPRILEVGADLFIGDLVRTSAAGRVEIVFSDETQLVVGPGSTLEIDDYLLRSDGSAGSFAVKALAGTFRFVTGSSDHDRYRIITPTGTIGVRGTAFDLAIDASGSKVIMYQGATELCTRSGACRTIADKCELGALSADGVTSSGNTSGLGRAEQQALRKQFVFGASQQGLSAGFRLRETAECLLAPLPFSPGFFTRLNDAPDSSAELRPAVALPAGPTGDAPAGALDPSAPADTPSADTPPAPPSPPAPAPDTGGDCAGNSDHNPGKSSNCNK